MGDPLKLFVIYDHPRDYPSKWVVRQWLLHKHDPYEPQHEKTTLIFVPTSEHRSVAYRQEPVEPPMLFDSLEDARACAGADGRACLARMKEDDPKIVETWL